MAMAMGISSEGDGEEACCTPGCAGQAHRLRTIGWIDRSTPTAKWSQTATSPLSPPACA